MFYLEAPNHADIIDYTSIFLGGGITSCADWQKIATERLLKVKKPFYLVNPRRAVWDMEKNDAAAQIEWEHFYLGLVTGHLFWFSDETLCPIVLFELGKHLRDNKPLFVGIHPNYARKFDVKYQLQLARPDVEVVEDLELLLDKVEAWL